MIFSILIPTLPIRIPYLNRLLNTIMPQVKGLPVEVLWFGDGKRRTLGDKRNNMIELARGEYMSFIDDDDRVASDYVALILEAIEKNPGVDVIVFNAEYTINGSEPAFAQHGIEFEGPPGGIHPDGVWRGKPAHTNVWKTSIARLVPFQDVTGREDFLWVGEVAKNVKTQVRIDKVLYYYDYDDRTTETRGYR